MRSAAVVAVSVLCLAACGEVAPVNPPTQPARPIEVVDPSVPVDKGATSMLPGRGPTSFVGQWAADVAWCAAPQGAERPIDISATRFEGYEHSCQIAAIDEVADGYVASLACLAQGVASSERVKMSVTGEVMRLTWLDRGEPVATTLRKCTTLTDTSDAPAALPIG